MIYKLVTFKLSLINIVRFLFLDGLNVNLNKKAKARTSLYFVSSFLFAVKLEVCLGHTEKCGPSLPFRHYLLNFGRPLSPLNVQILASTKYVRI